MEAARRPSPDPPFERLSVPQRVRQLRGQLSHDRFADQLGTSRQTVIEWEKGRRRPGPRYRAKLAELSGYPEEMFEGPQVERLELSVIRDVFDRAARDADDVAARRHEAVMRELASITEHLRILQVTVERASA